MNSLSRSRSLSLSRSRSLSRSLSLVRSLAFSARAESVARWFLVVVFVFGEVM